MTDPIKVLKNAGWLTSAQMIARILSAVFVILLANHLLPSSFGVYNAVIAFSYLFTVVVDWGLDEMTIREVSRQPDKGSGYLSDILFLRIFLGLLTILFISVVYHFVLLRLEIDIPYAILMVAIAMLIFEKLSNTFSAQFQARERMELQAYATLIWKMLYLLLGISAIFLGYDLFKILLFLLISYMIHLFVSAWIYESKLPDSKITNPSLKRWVPLLKKSSPFTLFITVSVIYGQVIIVLLSFLSDSFTTGVYSASWKVIIFLGVVPYSFGRAVYPVFSRLYTSRKDTIEHAYLETLRFLLILSLPLTLGLYVIAEDALELVYAIEYQQTIQVFRTIVWMLPFLFMNGSLKMVLWSSDRTFDSSKNLLGASTVLVLCGVLLIPPYGAEGAAVAIVLAEITHFLLNYHIVSTHLSPAPISYVWKPYLSSLLMGGLLYLPILLNLQFSVLWLLPLGIVLYFVFLYAIGGIGEKDIRLVKEFVKG
ncbi:MAG: flippase [Candidatus Saliniplasma sp.]